MLRSLLAILLFSRPMFPARKAVLPAAEVSLSFLAPSVSRHQDLRRQSALERFETYRQPCRAGTASGRHGTTLQPIGPGRETHSDRQRALPRRALRTDPRGRGRARGGLPRLHRGTRPRPATRRVPIAGTGSRRGRTRRRTASGTVASSLSSQNRLSGMLAQARSCCADMVISATPNHSISPSAGSRQPVIT